MWYRIVMLCALGCALLAGCQGPQTGSAPPTAIAPTITSGSHVVPPRALHDFTLIGSDGEALSLSDLRGAPVLLFFGYMHCPDVCPTTLADLHRARELLGEAGADVQVLFVSVDGARDTPEQIRLYLEHFDSSFIGMTGDEATLRRIGADYGLYFERRDIQGSSAGYFVDHTATTYLIDAEGNLRVLFPFGTPPEVYAEELRGLLDGG